VGPDVGSLETEHGTRRTLVLELCVPDLFVRVEDMGGVGETGWRCVSPGSP
jgi:hypothetical protein